MATRTGMAVSRKVGAQAEHYPEKWACRFAVDFVGGDSKVARTKRH
ncbi:hypothetical protein ACNKHL_10550 [Shigella flexneri]